MCTCDDVHTLCRWCLVHVALAYIWDWVHVVHVVVQACSTMYVHCVVTVSWHVYSLCCTLCGYMYYVVLYIEYRRMSCVVYQVYVYEFCGVAHCVWMYASWCTLRRYMCCVVSYTKHSSKLYTLCRCMWCMSGVGACIAWCCMKCVIVCVWCTLCVGAHGLGEGTRCFSGVETDQECIRNRNKGRI